jgi:hypothetical protein
MGELKVKCGKELWFRVKISYSLGESTNGKEHPLHTPDVLVLQSIQMTPDKVATIRQGDNL